MVNPFVHAGKSVAGMFKAPDECDFFAPTPLKIGAVLVPPIVAPVAFVAAFFRKSK